MLLLIYIVKDANKIILNLNTSNVTVNRIITESCEGYYVFKYI